MKNHCHAACLAVFAILVHGAAFAEPVAWRGQWIAPDGPSEPNSWWCYRTTVTIDEADGPVTARIACDSKYWLWINGELVVFEGGVKRGPTPTSTYYDEVDLTGRLERGENTIAVLVWHFGRDGMSHKNSGRVGLLFDAEVGSARVVSDDAWRVIRHPAYVSTGEPSPNWRLPESNVGFNAADELGDWRSPGFDASAWSKATPVGPPPVGPWGEVLPTGIPLLRYGAPREYENVSELPSVSDGKPIVARLPYNAQVTPLLEVEGPAGRLIDIRTDNYRGGGETNVRAEYITREGRQAYESLGWMNGHEVIYTIPAGIKVHRLRYRESGYDTDLAGSFECSDEQLNTLWRKAQRTLYLEMRDNFADCPGRERAQWWGDVTLELQQGFYGLDPRAARLARKAIRELAAWQRPSGVLHAPVPAGNYDQELPMQMLASVGRQGFWEYYRHTGDVSTIAKVYPAVRRYLDLWELDESGLVVERKGDWTWGDWGTNKDMSLLYNGWYCLALDGQLRMARLVGDTESVPSLEQKIETLRGAFHQAFWNGSEYRSPGHSGPTDDRGNALAIIAGLAPPETHDAIAEVLNTQRYASPYMEKYVLEALIRIGRMDLALARMRERYAPMIDSPITTLWEGWGIGPEGYGGGSYNHAWSGGPLTLLSQYVAGIDPLEPTYTRFRVAPQLGDLRFANAVVASPRGRIRVEVRRDGDAIVARVTCPPDSQAEVVLPRAEGAVLTLDGEPAPGPSVEVGPGDHVIAIAPGA